MSKSFVTANGSAMGSHAGGKELWGGLGFQAGCHQRGG